MLQGVALIDKPLGVSSHHVVARVRKALGTKKIGHAGTLDPAATGLLVLGVGAGTRLLTYLVGLDKTYHATMRLGYATTTDDAEGERLEGDYGDVSLLTPEAIEATLVRFRGRISQVPSTFSAIKVAGKRAYDLARAGEDVELASREVTISRLVMGAHTPGAGYRDVELEIDCSSGTYIRALARDIGAQLGVGGHLVALRRTLVGPFSLDDAQDVEDLTEEDLQSLSSVATQVMPRWSLTSEQTGELRHGRAIACEGVEGSSPMAAVDLDSGDLVAVVDCTGQRTRILMGVPTS